MGKVRLSVYLEPELMNALAAYADRRERSRSLIAEAAIAAFLSPDGDEQREAALSKRLDRADRRIGRVERDVAITAELLALYVRYWLANTPPPPEAAREAMRRQGGDRYDAFLAALGRKLATGVRLRQEILEDVPEQHSDAAD